MSETKVGTNIFQIMIKGISIYIRNFLPLTRVMLFPAFGIAGGSLLSLYLPFVYMHFINNSKILESVKNPAIVIFVLLGSLLFSIPGLIILIKAFWEYLIAMVSLNSMVWDIQTKGTFEYFKTYNSSVAARKKDYIKLLLFYSLFCLIPFLIFILPFLANTRELLTTLLSLSTLICIIGLIIVLIVLSLIFQIFAFEKLAPFEIIKKSSNLIKSNFCRTLFMGTILAIITNIIPEIITFLAAKTGLVSLLKLPFTSILHNESITAQIGSFSYSTIYGIINSLMLPLGSACFTLLYFDILERKNADV